MCRLLLLSALLPLLFAAAPPAQAHDAALDALARRAMKQWRIPGLAIAVVRDDRVLYLKGLGLRELGKPDPVTPDTIFPLGSCTKSFTTLAMGMLVDEGKLDWDDPVRRRVPWFHLADACADESVTLRDLVTHRTGVGSHDLLWYRSPWDLEERIRRAGKLELSRPFRTAFQYQAVLFSVAGLAVGRASGGTWEDFVQQRILDPLEMKASLCALPEGAAKRELASPHREGADDKVAVVPRYPMATPDPTSTLHSTARDLTNYLRFQLGDGAWKGRRLISAESLAEPHTPQLVLRRVGLAKAMNPETLFLHYGMGWVVQDYRGKLLVMHGGAIDGFRVHLTLVPEAHLGIAILANVEGAFLTLALNNGLVDHLLGLPTRDWDGYYAALHDEQMRDERARAKALRERLAQSRGALRPLSAYAGTYHDDAFGDCRVEVRKGKLVWTWTSQRCELEHLQGDVFVGSNDLLNDAMFVFTPGPGGRAQTLHVLDRSFERKAP